MLIVPDKLNQNAKSVQDMSSPEESGLILINYMCKRIDIKDLANFDVLDFGCGVRFSQSILNLDIPVGSYFGLDTNRKVIKFLDKNVSDNRMRYKWVNIYNKLYNRWGSRLDVTKPSPLGNNTFDIACMFSVITHQNPIEAEPTFKLLRQHIRSDGHLFFSAFIHDDDIEYKELIPKKPGAQSSYSYSYMTRLLEGCGWKISSYAEPVPDGVPIMSSFLCKPI